MNFFLYRQRFILIFRLFFWGRRKMIILASLTFSWSFHIKYMYSCTFEISISFFISCKNFAFWLDFTCKYLMFPLSFGIKAKNIRIPATDELQGCLVINNLLLVSTEICENLYGWSNRYFQMVLDISFQNMYFYCIKIPIF